MGPLLMAGLAILGATVAIGLVTSNAVPSARPDREPPNVRSFSIVVMAFAAGIGVLGVVVGMLAVVRGLVGDPSSAFIVTLGPAILGAAIALATIVRAEGAVDTSVRLIAANFIVGQVILAGVVALLATTIRETGGNSPSIAPFAVLGIVAAAGAIGLGISGAGGLRAIAASDDERRKQVASDQLRRCLPFDLIAVTAEAGAIVLVVTAQ